MKSSGHSSASGTETETEFSTLTSSEAILESGSSWVSASGIIIVTVWLTWLSLGVGGSQMDWNINRSVNWLWVLSSMDSNSSESLDGVI